MMNESEDEVRNGSTILVAGVLKDYEDVLEALVSNKRKGGGSILNFQYDEVLEVAWITFADAAVAEFFLKTGAIKIQGHTMKVLVPPSPRTLFVRGVSTEVNEMLELFLESPKKGGGPISEYNFDISSETVTVSFEKKEVAVSLLEQKFIEVKGKQLFFSNVPSEALLPPPAEGSRISVDEEKPEQDNADVEDVDDTSIAGDNAEAEALARTVCIQNVPSNMVEFLEVILTQEKSGGGSIEQLIEDGDNVMVTFEDSDVAARYLEVGVLKFGMSEFAIVPPPSQSNRIGSDVFDEERDNEEDKLPSATVLVRGIPKHMPQDILLALLEREQDGGGTVVSTQTEDEHAIVQFEDYRVAQRLLSAGRIQFKQTTLEIVPVPEDNPQVAEAEDTIEIQKIPKGTDKDKLQLFLENKKRSGGGDVVELILNETTGRAIVQFQDVAVAKNLLENGKIKYTDGSMLEVCRPASSPDCLNDPSQGATEIPGQVEISGIPPGTKSQTLMMFLENKKRSGGGEIAEDGFTFDERSGTAMVTFKDPAIAEQVLQKGQITFGKSVIKVQKPTNASCISSSASVETSLTNVQTDEVKSRTVEIRGHLLKDLSKENISLYFENKKRSGGGTVDSVQILSKDSAIIVFKQAQDAACVAEKHEHHVSKVKLTATLLDSWPDVGGPCAIKVQGFKIGTSRDMIEMYFENRKRSGGENFDELLYEEGNQIAVITFSNPQAVQRIISKEHVLEGNQLTVEALMPSRPPPLLKLEEIDPDKLLFTKLDSLKIDSKKLQEFAGNAGKAPVRKITYSSRPGIALIQYDKQPDYESVKAIICSRPFQGKMISVQRVQVTNCIQVHSIGTLTQDSLELYFESRKNGGGDLKILKFIEGNHAIIEFAERDVLQRVLSKKHTFSGQDLEVQLYCPCLGIFPPGFDGSSPALPIPPDFKMKCDTEIVHFLLTPHQKKHIEHHLKKRKCFLVWPRHGGNQITLRCTIESSDPNAYQITQAWKGACESFLEEEISNVKFGEINVLDEIWNSFKDKVSAKRNLQENQLLLTEFDDQRHVLFYSGHAKEAEKFKKSAEDVKRVLEEELDRSKREIRESAGLKPYQAYLVKATSFYREQTDVRFEESAKGFTIIGQPIAVRQAKLKCLEIANKISERLVDFKAVSDVVEKALNKPAMQDYVHECFAKSNVLATYVVQKKDVILHAIEKKQLDHACEILISEVLEKSIDLDEPMREVLRKKDWTTYKAALAKDFPLLELSESNASVAFASKRSDMPAISQRIKDFLSGNAHYEKFVALPKGKMEVLKKYGNSELEQLRERIKPAEMKECQPSSGEWGFSIRGKKLAMDQGVAKVKEFLMSVCSSDYPINKKQAVKLFPSGTAGLALHGICSVHRVVIKFADEEKDDSKGKAYSDPVTFATAKLRHSGKFIKLVLGDITKDKTDTVVNAANSRLEHGSGVARAIAKAGGPRLEEECRDHVRKGGEIHPGAVFVSSAGGSLPHKSVIHTVGPVWKDGKSGEDRDLQQATLAALREAENRYYQSVSLPFLSCGIFSFPKKRAATIIVRSIKEFLSHSKYVYEVHIVNGIQDCLNTLQSAFTEFSSDFELTPSVFSGPSSGPGRSTTWKRPQSKYKTGSHSHQTARSGTNSLQTPEGITVRLIRGSIASSKVDAIFNSAEKDLNLSRTAVSKSLLTTAGSSLQDECQASWPQGIGYGNVVKTGAHRLPCKAVYHGACARWDNDAGSSEQVIRKLVSSTLQMATDDGMTSLAFPAVGTGIKLKTPSNVVARLMIDETVRFSAKVPKTSLTEIQFVIYEKDQDTLDAFEKELCSSGGDRKNASTKTDSDEEADADVKDQTDDEEEEEEEGEEEESNEEHDSGEDEDGKEEAVGGDSGDSDSSENGQDNVNQRSRTHEQRRGRGGRGRGHRGVHHHSGHEHARRTNYSPATSAPGVTGADCQIGSIKFLVKQEDIIRSSSDAIINGTNDKLNLKMGKLSRAIFIAAGNQIQAECMQNGFQGGMAVSSGGKLPFKYIFHITAKDTKGWKAVIGNVLQQADSMRLKSISIPPVGVGRGSVTVEDLAEAIYDEVENFSQKQPQFLQTITVSILDQGMLNDFITATEKASKLQNKPLRKFLSKAADVAKAVFNDFKDSFTGADDSKEYNGGRKKSHKGRKTKSTTHLPPSKRTLRIYGLSASSVSSAISDIQQHCKETKLEAVLESAPVKEAISKLTADQEKKLKSLEKQCAVEIKIDKTTGNQKIRLVTEDGDLSKATAGIFEILLGMVTKERDSKVLELFAKQAVWQYDEGGTFKNYGRYATGTIEKAYHHREPTLEYKDSKNVKHKINFKDMTDDRSQGGKVPIKRTVPDMTKSPTNARKKASKCPVAGSIALPSRWKPMAPSDNSITVILNPSDQEYQKVEKSLKATAQNTLKSIIQIERIQNPVLYRQFMNRKLDMDRTNPGQENEKRLWHGTNGNNVVNINNRNFNRSYCGQHGTAIGNGVYFASNASYSVSGYCPADGAGQKHIYQARVLTGKYCQGRGGLKEAPPLPNRTDVTYDSVVDNPANPGMYVVFLDYQTYPEYHITFT